MNLQNNDMSKDDNPLGYPDRFSVHLSQQEADRQLLQEHEEGLRKFIDALQMKNPISKEQGLMLLESLVRDNAVSHVNDVASAMRMLNWNSLLGAGENLMDVAGRAFEFFNTHVGIEVFNGVMKTVAKIEDDMWTADRTSTMQSGN